MERFCDELRWERERRQVSIEKICQETKVAPRHLLALEAGEYDALPGGVFRKGIVRSYLAALGLEEVPWIERFEMSLQESGAQGENGSDWTEFAQNVQRNRVAKQSKTSLRWMGVILMLPTLLIFSWIVWKFAVHVHLLP